MRLDKFLSNSVTKRAGRTPPSPGERVMARMFPNASMGSYANWGYQDRAKQISHFVSWAYAAININASLVGQHTPNMAFVSNDEDSDGSVHRNVRKWYGMGMGLTTGATKDGDVYSPGGPGGHVGLHLGSAQRTGHGMYPGYARYKAYSTIKPHEELEPLPGDHELHRLWANPNPYDTSYTLQYELVMFLKLTGIAYIWCVPDGFGIPRELWCLPSHWVWPRTGTGAYADPRDARLISYYEIRPYGSGISGSGLLRIPKEEVIQFRYPSPLSQIDGWSKLTAVSMWLDTNESMDKSAWSQMQNQGLPSCFVELSPEYSDPSQELIDRMEAKFMEKLGGEYNVGKPLFGTAGMKITPLSFSPESMMYPAMGEIYRDKILAAFGIPKSVLGMAENMTYGSLLASLSSCCTFVINPDFSMIGQQLTKDLCPRFMSLGYRAKTLGGYETGFAKLDNGKRRILTDLEMSRVARLDANGRVKRFKVNEDTGDVETTIRLWWDDCSPPDPSQVNSDIAQDMQCLAISPDEVRAIRGRAPWGDPQAGNPWVNGPNGWVPIPLAVQDKDGMERLAALMEPLKKMGEEQGTHVRDSEDKPNEQGMNDDGQPTLPNGEEAEPALENDLPDVTTDPGIENPNGKPHKSLKQHCSNCGEHVKGFHQCDVGAFGVTKEVTSQETGPVAAGLAVVANDTGRVLLLQRQLDPEDPNAGKWELPGGKTEGMKPLETAVKEWTEEVGLPLPEGKLTGRSWASSDGKYQGFVYRVPAEFDLNCRSHDADPESGGWAAVAWVDPKDLPNHNLRPALLEDIDDVLAQVTKHLLAGGKIIHKGWKADDRKLARQKFDQLLARFQSGAVGDAHVVDSLADYGIMSGLKVTEILSRMIGAGITPDSASGAILYSRAKPIKSFSQKTVKGWRRIGPPHESQTINDVELRLVNLGNHMGGSKWRLGVVQDGEVAWKHDAKTRAELDDKVPKLVQEELGRRRMAVKSYVNKAACGPGERADLTGCTPLGGGSSTSEAEDLDDDLQDPSEVVGELLNLNRQDERELDGLRNTKVIRNLSTVPVSIDVMDIDDLKGLELVDEDEVDPVEDPEDVPPVIIGPDGDFIDGNHRVTELLAGGQTQVRVIRATEDDLKAAKEFGGLQGRGSWSEEMWIKWMQARTELE